MVPGEMQGWGSQGRSEATAEAGVAECGQGVMDQLTPLIFQASKARSHRGSC